MLVLLLFY